MSEGTTEIMRGREQTKKWQSRKAKRKEEERDYICIIKELKLWKLHIYFYRQILIPFKNHSDLWFKIRWVKSDMDKKSHMNL